MPDKKSHLCSRYIPPNIINPARRVSWFTIGRIIIIFFRKRRTYIAGILLLLFFYFYRQPFMSAKQMHTFNDDDPHAMREFALQTINKNIMLADITTFRRACTYIGIYLENMFTCNRHNVFNNILRCKRSECIWKTSKLLLWTTNDARSLQISRINSFRFNRRSHSSPC